MKTNPFLSFVRITCIFFTSILLFNSCKDKKNAEIVLVYPETIKVDTIDNYFGTLVPDPYRWLENNSSKEAYEWIALQNQVTSEYFSNIPYRDDIKERLLDIWDFPKETEPIMRGGKLFYYKNDGLQNQNVLYYKNSINGKEIELLDPNKLSDDGTFFISAISISDDGKYLGYSVSKAGSDWQDIYVKEIETKKDLDDKIKWAKFSAISWYGDGFFYKWYPKNGEYKSNSTNKISYHKIGTSQKEDITIHEDKVNPEYSYYAGVVNSKKYIYVNSSHLSTGNKLKIKKLGDENASFVTVTDDFDNRTYVVDEIDGYLYLITNYNAPKFKVVRVDVENPSKDNWEDFIKEDEGVIQTVDFLSDKFIINYMQDAHSVVKIFDENGTFLYNIDKDLIGSIRGFSGERNDSITFYSVTSFTSPSTIYMYNVKENRSTLYKSPKIKIDPDDYITKQVFYQSKDGTKIPMFIIHKKNLKMNGNNPAILYGYGGFGLLSTPYFDITKFIFLEQGGIYAVANLRGGGEYGEEWHKAGIVMNKQNVFDDYISAAEYLIAERYTSPKKLAAHGASNGGITVAAAINQRPDLFSVMLSTMPITDMLRYHLYSIGRFWASDYGTSADSEEMFKYLYAYSPLHNIRSDIQYPATLITTTDIDERVAPVHSFKYIATLQDKYKGKKPMLIRIETQSGFFGSGKPTDKAIEEYTDMYAFTFYNLNITPKY